MSKAELVDLFSPLREDTARSASGGEGQSFARTLTLEKANTLPETRRLGLKILTSLVLPRSLASGWTMAFC